ncbi:MAG: hypothetical protein IJJ41_06890 [Clostridia bacterium]|nr:hypothetical protein [Clostridia bacterium]
MKTKIIIISVICIAVLAIAGIGIYVFVSKNNAKKSETVVTTEQTTQTQTTTKKTGSKNAPVRIACVGDSITYGYGIENRENTYPAKLGQLLGEGYEVVNYGLSGRTVQLSADKPYALEYEFEQSKEFTPDIVLFMLGTNDTKKINWDKDQFKNDFLYMVDSYRGLPNAPKVYVLIPPPVYLSEKRDTFPRGSVLATETVPIIKALAKQENITTIDMFEPFKGKLELYSDGCHPNEAGAELMANIIYKQIIVNEKG